MKHHITRLLISLALLFSINVVLAGPPPDIANQAKNSFIFKFALSVKPEEMQGLAASLTSKHNGTLRHVFTNVIHGFSAMISRENAQRLVDNEGEVTGFVNNGVAHVPGAEGSANKGGQGGKGKPGSTAGEHYSWPFEQGLYSSHDGSGGHAWIIDSGIDDYYADSELNIGYGVNYVTKGQYTTDDTNGHGTAVAGIIAALDNDTGMVGVAAGATVHPVRVLHKNLWGTVDDIIKGVDYVAGEIPKVSGKNVVNMSITIEEDTNDADLVAMFNIAINDLANLAPVAVCAGNQGLDLNVTNITPANSSNPNVYTVASIDDQYNLASDSNTGDAIDFVAPGVHIETLKPGGGTWYWSGCSMATPHVAGILLVNQPDGPGGEDIGIIYPLATF